MKIRLFPLAQSGLLATALVFAACGSSGNDGSGTGGTRGSGSGGSGGKGGSGGSSSTGGSSGSAGSGGSSATGGSSGTGGSGGSSATGGSSGTGGSGGSSATDGSAGDVDAAPADDAGTTPTADGGPTGTATCGTTPASFDLSSIGKSEGLVVAPDGTVYLSDFGAHVIRYAPPYDKPPEKTWATVAGATILGIMYDPKKKVIYAGSRGSDLMLYSIDATDPTKITSITGVEKGYNGLTIADDGSLFYTDQDGGQVYRVDPAAPMASRKTKVTKTPVPNADGIAFGPDKQIYIIPYQKNPPITRIKIENNLEVSRDTFATVQGGSGDGIAFDSAGNLYVTAGGLFKIAAADKAQTTVSPMGGANVEFGVGAMSCKDIIVASGPPHHHLVDTDGADVYWHRP